MIHTVTGDDQTVLVSVGTFGLLLTASTTVYHIYYVLWVETRLADGTVTVTRLKQTFNANLIFIGLSVMGLYIAFIVQAIYQSKIDSTPWILQAVNDFFTASFEVAYINYSSSRSFRIITRVFPKLQWFLHYYLKALPFIIYIQVIPATFDAICATRPDLVYLIETGTVVEQSFSILAAFFVLVFDVIFLCGFIKFVTSIRRQLAQDTDATFAVISRFGLASCVCAVSSFLCYAGTMAFEPYGFEYNLMIGIAYICLSGVQIALALMKIKLHTVTEKADGDSTRKKMLDTAEKGGSKIIQSLGGASISEGKGRSIHISVVTKVDIAGRPSTNAATVATVATVASISKV
ncbi:UNVERIFIED_CONTAM: hypothetical protein HDU68_001649 [Siphonaria sp. JEL0065]|nr:hypothetical protein HDU68_001649 [Siphonaria sp. JEL0065]